MFGTFFRWFFSGRKEPFKSFLQTKGKYGTDIFIGFIFWVLFFYIGFLGYKKFT